jgi:hypothetical protein
MHAPHLQAPQSHTLAAPPAAMHDYSAEAIKQLQAEVEELRQQLAQVRKDLDDLWSNFR